MENFELSSLGAGLVALAFWGFIAAVAVAGIWDGIRKRDAQHETVRRLLESGQQTDQATLEKLLSLSDGGNKHPDRDFKITALWILPVAPGLALLGLILGAEAQAPLLGVAVLVACLGIGFLLAGKIAERWIPSDTD